MKACRAFFAIFLPLAAFCPLAAQEPAVVGKTTIHRDGTKTESVSDPNTRQLEQKTFDANGVLILRRHYQLNERGLPVMGNIYDGSGNLVARSQSVFDTFGRLQEERLSNLQGEVYQQIIHEYDLKGNPKKPKVINYKVSAPTMRPAMIDFTPYQQPGGEQPAAATASGTGAGRVKAPVNLDQQAPAAQPRQPAAKPQTEEPPKKGFFRRLFGR